MKLYNIDNRAYEAKVSSGIKLESKLNSGKWEIENMEIDNREVEFYYSNCSNLRLYYHFIYKDKWYRIRRNRLSLLMGEQLYTKKTLKNLCAKKK